MTLENIFAQVQAMASNAPAIGASLKFDMGERGVVVLDGSGDANVITTTNQEADCTIKVSAKDFEKVLSGELNPMMAFMSGAITIEGDMSVAMKLQSLLG